MLQAYYTEFAEDTTVTPLTIKDRMRAQPNVRHKWLFRLIQHKKRLNELKSQLEMFMESEKNKDPALLNVSVPRLQQRIAMMPEYKQLQMKIEDEELLVEYLDGCQKIMNSMTYDLKNMVEIMKMEYQV